MYRVEDKYLLDKLDMFTSEKKISSILERDKYSSKGSYKISSLYFDSINNDCYYDTLSGIESRNKYRIRIYNDEVKTIKLEVKKKKQNRILKLSSIISYEEMENLIHGNTIDSEKDIVSAKSIFNYEIKCRGLSPQIIVEYNRTAYVYDYGNVRITYDRNVRVSNSISSFGKGEITDMLLCENADVLEVKYDEYLPAFIAQVLENNNMTQISYSKYLICRERNNYVSSGID